MAFDHSSLYLTFLDQWPTFASLCPRFFGSEPNGGYFGPMANQNVLTPQPSLISHPLADESPRIRVGTSGFSYTEWRGKFYPADLSPKKFLSYYAQHFPTTEVNNTFYRIPTPTLVRNWRNEVPPEFQLTLKVSQIITHRKNLKEVEPEMQSFLEGAAALSEKLATLLVQLPPFFRKEIETLEDFLKRFSSQARLAFEFRHRSWFCDDVYQLLRQHQCALAVVEKEEGDVAEAPREVTAPFIYMR